VKEQNGDATGTLELWGTVYELRLLLAGAYDSAGHRGCSGETADPLDQLQAEAPVSA
jgi:hypothetical protein